MKKIYLTSVAAIMSLFALAQNIGIGVVTPAERLHVVHTADVNKNTIYGYASQLSGGNDYQNTGVAGFGQGNGVPGGFGYGFGVKGIGSLNSYGAVGVYAGLGTTIPQNNLIGGSFYSLYADAGIPTANRYAGVFLNGNVGVGTSTPLYKFDVSGDANVTGALRITGDANIIGALRTNGNAGTTGQVLTSNGAGAASWSTLTTTNNTRFAAQMPTSNATGGVTGFMTFFSNYNLNTSDITFGPDYITVNRSGLYHFEGVVYDQVSYSATPSQPVFTFNLVNGSVTYNLIIKAIPISNASTTSYYDNNKFGMDIYVSGGNQIKLSRVFNANTTNLTSMFAQGWFSGYLISD